MNPVIYKEFIRFLTYIKTTNQKPPAAAKILWQLTYGMSKANSIDQIELFADEYINYITGGTATNIIGKKLLDDVLCIGGGEYVGTPTPYIDNPADIKSWHQLAGQIAYGVSIGQSTPYLFNSLSYSIPAFRFDQTEYDAVINHIATAPEIATAVFWAAGGGTYTPPGMWVKSAIEQLKTRADFLKVMYYLTNALANASIVCWQVKYRYRTARPKNVAPIGWTPVLATPPFPGYTSGHSAFSQAAGIIFDKFNLSPIVIGTASTRTYASNQEAVDEAGISRLLGQIHIPQDNVNGKLLGKQIAEQSLTLKWGC